MYLDRGWWLRQFSKLIRLGVLGLIVWLVMNSIVQTVFAKTYVVTDGDRILTHTSLSADPAKVLGQMGLILGQQDTYTTVPVAGVEAITICRAQEITIEYRGQTVTAFSTGESVGELLTRLGLEVTGEDTLSHSMEDRTHGGMVLRVDRTVMVRETFSGTLPHGVSYCDDPAVPVGLEDVLIEGVDGELLTTANVTYLNGKETKREILNQTVLRSPVTEVIGRGIGKPAEPADPNAMPIIDDGYITLPTGEVLTYYKTDTVRATAYTHTDKGCDRVTATGTTVHWGTVAVDPRYIPYGTRMFIMASDGSYIYGIAVAEDCGGDIKGDRMDLYMPSFEKCREFGRRRCTLYFLG